MPVKLSRRDLEHLGDDPVFLEAGFHLALDLLGGPSDPDAFETPDGVPVRRAPGGGGAVVTLLAEDDGAVLARLAADALDAWRTALPAGLVARYFAPPGADVLGLCGTGPVAWACLRALTRALPTLRRVRVTGPNAVGFAADAAKRTGLPVTAAADAGADADVLAITEPGCADARRGALVLTTGPAPTWGEHGPRRELAWDDAVRAVLDGVAAPRADGLLVVLGDNPRTTRWQRSLDGWALRRAWELDVGLMFTVD
ncbi:hypothetical protein V5P93_005745 [Actinokineospora auranticolor]|uniref:Ornithine cyclodeaminase/mu-crystallin family protein n=1 Tax=Actinokineospora auranticolor TaxID=155976 RepID=A0A2S6GJT9_9PSEU|nr:hypothetical protein [Actinokineospora auranticolor]PPK65475.1 ornithine cyclodeaminase/mu-crystallin family protein [Actinokineospora auranticolor]